jgi:hypothetical protein
MPLEQLNNECVFTGIPILRRGTPILFAFEDRRADVIRGQAPGKLPHRQLPSCSRCVSSVRSSSSYLSARFSSSSSCRSRPSSLTPMPAYVRVPAVAGLPAHPELSTDLRECRARLGPAQRVDHLLLGKRGFLHPDPSLGPCSSQPPSWTRFRGAGQTEGGSQTRQPSECPGAPGTRCQTQAALVLFDIESAD